MAKGEGPQRAILALGYAGWAPGQLENEIQHNGWLTCAADEELLFGLAYEDRYTAALRKLKIDPGMLSSDAGHA
jgi:putative transcriptional regulator